MIRRINYTGRRRIPRSLTTISLVAQSDSAPSFRAKLRLDDLGLQTGAAVFVEAYYGSASMRFEFGRIGAVKPPPCRLLTELPTRDVVHFRVKVVDNKNINGRLLAVADRITVSVAPTKSLLPVNFVEMDNQTWRVDFSGPRPVLEVNSRLGTSMKEVVRSEGGFFSLVFPAALREILTAAVMEHSQVMPDTPDEWAALWLRFGESLLGKDSYPSEDGGDGQDSARKSWVRDVVEAFCEKHSVAKKFRESSIGRIA